MPNAPPSPPAGQSPTPDDGRPPRRPPLRGLVLALVVTLALWTAITLLTVAAATR
jgi:hypothetical protein